MLRDELAASAGRWGGGLRGRGGLRGWRCGCCHRPQPLGESPPHASSSSSSLLLLDLELSDTQVHAPWLRALLRTASHFCLNRERFRSRAVSLTNRVWSGSEGPPPPTNPPDVTDRNAPLGRAVGSSTSEQAPCLPALPTCHSSYLTQCFHQLVLESQLPHNTINLIF